MIFEVQYKHKKDAANRHAAIHLEYFDSTELPETPTIIKKLTEMHKDFEESTIKIAPTNRNPTRITKL